MQARRALLAASALAACVSMLVVASSLSDIAEAVAEDVGVVLEVAEGDPDRVIFVFEEQHDSILVQIEIAIMLDRLYADYGMRHMGVESLAVTDGPLDLSWAHWAPTYHPYEPITSREDVIAHTLFLGEIGAVEMMGLVYEDAVVNGIDDAELSAINLPVDTWVAPLDYVYNIALVGMDGNEYAQWEALYDAEKYEEAFDFAVSTDPFTTEAYDRLSDTVDMASAEETLEIYALLRMRARRERIDLPEGTEEDLAACEDFLMAVSERSDVMAEAALELASAHPGAPVAINIGAMHTERIIQLLEDGGVSYVLIRSLAQATGSLAGLLTLEQFDRKSQGLSVGGENHIASFLDGRKKPEVTSSKWWYKVEVGINNVVQLLMDDFTRPKREGEGGCPPEVRDWKDLLHFRDARAVEDMLRPFHVISFSTGSAGWQEDDVGNCTPYMTFEFTVKDPETGQETRIEGEAKKREWYDDHPDRQRYYAVEGEGKPPVTLRELLEEEHEATSTQPSPTTAQPGPATTTGEEQEPVRACSTATVVCKGA